MSADLSLGPLLTALRAAGVRVGAAEVARLDRVFALAPAPVAGSSEASWSRLKNRLRAVVVKSAEDGEAFEPVFAEWRGRTESAVAVRRPVAKDVGSTSESGVESQPERKKRIRWRSLQQVALLSVFLGFLTWLTFEPFAEFLVGKAIPEPQARPGPLGLPSQEEAQASCAIELTPAPKPRLATGLWNPEPIGGGLAFVAGLALAFVYLRRSWLPPAAAPLNRRGPPRVYWHPPSSPGPEFLAPAEQEALAYGIGHFLSEEPTRRLDVPQTVHATAGAAGLPKVFFLRARYAREVWLWLDEAADDPILARLADEVEAVLRAHGLPLVRALFRGVPEMLLTAEGRFASPSELDEHRDSVLVAILTDGRLLARQLAAGDRRVPVEALLRQLSHWPRLAFAGTSEAVTALLAERGLSVVEPSDLATFLGGGRRRSAPRSVSAGSWAAVCALAPASVDPETALSLRRELRLPVSPWALAALHRDARDPSGRLAWNAADRSELLNWLRHAEGSRREGTPAEGSLLADALTAWEQIYDRELASKRAEDRETPAYQHLVMERALLKLWRSPEQAAEAAKELFALFQGPLGPEIERRLADFAPARRGKEAQAEFPWRWQSLPAASQRMFSLMKLGGTPEVRLRRPGRTFLAVGLCLGLGVSALAGPIKSKPAPRPSIQKPALMTMVRIPEGEFTMGSPPNELYAFPNERPRHRVRMSTFWMGETEVTNEQYRILERDHRAGEPGDLPATYVDWNDASRFCQHFKMRLPTEAEWEYAARARSTGAWFFGDDESKLGAYAWSGENLSGSVHPVREKWPNPWGLYDIYGNAWEWVADWYSDRYDDSKSAPPSDPTGPGTGAHHVLRGGSFLSKPRYLRSAVRVGNQPGLRDWFIGFRCVRSAPCRP